MTTELDRPDEHEVGAGEELYCWMPCNDDRECNASCVAFESDALRDARLTSCKALNAMRAFGISVASMAKMMKVQERKEAVAAPSPPEVRS